MKVFDMMLNRDDVFISEIMDSEESGELRTQATQRFREFVEAYMATNVTKSGRSRPLLFALERFFTRRTLSPLTNGRRQGARGVSILCRTSSPAMLTTNEYLRPRSAPSESYRAAASCSRPSLTYPHSKKNLSYLRRLNKHRISGVIKRTPRPSVGRSPCCVRTSR